MRARYSQAHAPGLPQDRTQNPETWNLRKGRHPCHSPAERGRLLLCGVNSLLPEGEGKGTSPEPKKVSLEEQNETLLT